MFFLENFIAKRFQLWNKTNKNYMKFLVLLDTKESNFMFLLSFSFFDDIHLEYFHKFQNYEMFPVYHLVGLFVV